jgi:predicted Zn-dependent peptidase
MKNGIRVLIMERHISPTVAFYIRIKAGAADEIEGKTGLAHLLEHMMFKGTKTVGAINYAQERKYLTEIRRIGDRVDRERAKGDKADKELVGILKERLQAAQNEHRRWYRSNEIDRLYNEHGAVHINASTGQDMITYHVSLPANKAELWARIEADRMSNTRNATLLWKRGDKEQILIPTVIYTKGSPRQPLWCTPIAVPSSDGRMIYPCYR